MSQIAGRITAKTQRAQRTALPRICADHRGFLFGVIFVLLVCASVALAQPAAAPARGAGEQRASRYLESIRGNPEPLEVFLRAMPKGADLHNHLVGAVYAESFVAWAAADGLCVDVQTMTLIEPKPPCDATTGRRPAADALTDTVLYRKLVDALSMRHFSGALESAHDHFFDTFMKFDLVTVPHRAQEVQEVVSRAASQHVEYMELITNFEFGKALALGLKVGWDDNWENLAQKVDANGAAEIVAGARQHLDKLGADVRKLLRCDQPDMSKEERERREREGGRPTWPDAGCQTTVRYIYEVYRGMPPQQVFAQIQVGFELAASDRRVVSVNPVQPEDWYVSLRDYDLHMRMFDFFHKKYPKVKLTMHAGELAPGLVPPRRLHDHIRDAIEKGGAQRIGHGVDIMQEDDPFELLEMMKKKKIMVEINLTSNDMILGVTGMRHPFPVYLKWGVPVALSTDDEGVSRGNITHEYLRATLDYKLTYAQLKKLSRTGIEYGFADEATKKQLLSKFDKDFADFERECCENRP